MNTNRTISDFTEEELVEMCFPVEDPFIREFLGARINRTNNKLYIGTEYKRRSRCRTCSWHQTVQSIQLHDN